MLTQQIDADGYLIGADGTVIGPRGWPLKSETIKGGYLRVMLRGRHRLVHVLVAEAFIGPRPVGLEVNHIDGDKTNNHVSNLEYVTPSDNVRLPGLRIGDRTKPLRPKTIARIEAGLIKYGREPHLTVLRSDRPRPIPMDGQFATIVADGSSHALVVPVEGRDGKQATASTEPMRTMTTRAETALVVPYYGNGQAQPAGRPMPTVTTVDGAALVVPSGGTWNETAYTVADPFRTQATRECQGIAFIAELRGGGSGPRDVTEPLATVTASGNHHMLVRNNSSKGPGGEMCTPVSEPARTITTTGHQSLVSIEQQVQDSTFRMLEPTEIQAAMAFRVDYRVLGNRRERVRQLGNAVTPPAAEFLIRAVAAALHGEPA